MKLPPFRMAQIGVGGFGATHLECNRMLEREGFATLVAVADPSIDRLAEIKTELEGVGIHWHTDYRDMLESESLDAISIATPIHLHEAMARETIHRNLFIYLEKPPVPTIQQLEGLIQLDREERVHVGFQWISSPWIRTLKEWRVKEVLGRLLSVRVSGGWPRPDSYYHRSSWAGRLIEKGHPVFDGPATNALAHFVHNAMYLASPEPEGFDVPEEVTGEFYRMRPIEGYDAASFRGRFSSGVEFVFTAAHCVEQMVPVYLELVGEKGRAWMFGDKGGSVGNDRGLLPPSTPVMHSRQQAFLDFADFVLGRRQRAVTRLQDARGYVLSTHAALVSSGGIRTIPEKYGRRYEKDGNCGYDVPGLAEAVSRSVREGKLLSELGLPWAKKGETVSVHGLRSLDLNAYISV